MIASLRDDASAIAHFTQQPRFGGALLSPNLDVDLFLRQITDERRLDRTCLVRYCIVEEDSSVHMRYVRCMSYELRRSCEVKYMLTMQDHTTGPLPAGLGAPAMLHLRL